MNRDQDREEKWEKPEIRDLQIAACNPWQGQPMSAECQRKGVNPSTIGNDKCSKSRNQVRFS